MSVDDADEMCEADIVIVGAGSAGCVLAARLSEIPTLKVLLVEAGPRDRNPWIHIPVGFSRLLHNPSVNWMYETVPQAALGGRQVYWPRGKVLGGSSAINGLVWVRGGPDDFDAWSQALQDPSWSWENVASFFRRIEAAPADVDPRLGNDGTVGLRLPQARYAAVDAFLQAANAAGLKTRPDLSIADHAGVGQYLATTRNGLRTSAARAYLRAASGRSNLALMTNATALRLEISPQKQVTGVHILQGGRTRLLRASRGVVVAGGAINSPKLLMLSGIGPAAHLTEHGIPVLHDAPQVGENLQDHYGVRVIAELNSPITINDDFRRPWRLAMHAARYALFRSGPVSVGGAYAGAFFSTDGGETPDMQVHFLPMASNRKGWSFEPYSGVTANVCQMRPFSRGRITLASADPHFAPKIDPDYLGDPRDREALVKGIRFTRSIYRQPPFSTVLDTRERAPGADRESDADMLDYARTHGSTVFHPVGTCRMGIDRDAVVDPKCRVKAMSGLWVVDASVMPTITSGNTNAATIMIAEKISQEMARDLRTGSMQ